jgi:TPP-dependent pyruvate/acetoin dehydrogenase alpha subunit
MKKDPIDRLVDHLQAQQGQLSVEEWQAMDAEILQQVEDSVSFAKASAFPSPDRVTDDVFAA